MKIKSSVLIVLMTYLSVMPCDDIVEADLCSDETHFHIQNHEQEDGHSNTDHCSPFCTCNCCTTPIFFSDNSVESSRVPFNTRETNSNYQFAFSNRSLFSVWRPPQVS